jgi:hypothetical protein
MNVIGNARTTRSSLVRPGEACLGDECVVAAALEGDAASLGEQPHRFLADVVARAGVLLSRVAEPHDQPVVRLALADAPEQPHQCARFTRKMRTPSR